jgi:hypothetical protein
MIGVRAYVLTLLGVVLVALALADVHGTLNKPSACASANRLLDDHLLSEARGEYESLLKEHPATGCANTGLANTTARQCLQAMAVAPVDSSQARSALLALAAGDPAPSSTSCVFSDLATLSRQASSG